MSSSSDRPLVGITVLPEYFQQANEGVEGVLDNLTGRARANAVTTSPYVMAPADEQTGGREPPIDAGAGKVRLLDRPLWGQRELYVRTAPSFEPNKKLYQGLKYQPAEPNDLTRREGHTVADAIRAAQARHVKAYLQVQAAIPPGYRVQFGGPADEDKPRLPDGRVPPNRVANNASLACDEALAYTHALLADICQQYPDIDGIRVDWPEYPPYSLDDVFVDFSDHARGAAERYGLDFDRMRHDVGRLYQHLHGGLTDADLRPWSQPDGGRHALLRWLADSPGITDWLRFKGLLVADLLAGFRRAMDAAGGQRIALVAHAFPPPLSLASGLDFARAAGHCQGFCVKFYTMHWAMMVRFWGDALRQANPDVSPELLVRALVRWFDLDDGPGLPKLEDYRYPEPDEPHPVGMAAIERKLQQARREAGATPVYGLGHGYGSLENFRERLAAVQRAAPAGVWLNRYGYLSDAKLSAVGEVCGG